MLRNRVIIGVVLLLSLFLASCSAQPISQVPAAQVTQTLLEISTPEPSATPDLCAPNRIVGEVKKVNDVMRKFDDIMYVANLTQQANLAPLLLELQTARRESEDLQVPVCLQSLQISAVNYMNGSISYLAHFMGGVEKNTINSEIATTQQLRIMYESELARLLGATYVPPVIPTAAPTESATVAAPDAGDIPAGPAAEVKNTGETSVNLRNAPTFDEISRVIGYLQLGQTARAIARDPSSQWVLIEYQWGTNTMAWVYAPKVELSVPIDQLPSVGEAPTPTPAP